MKVLVVVDMQNAIAQIRQLQLASGSIKKMKVLQECKGNQRFCKLLYYALNPLLTYKISEATLRGQVAYNPAITLTMCDIFTICDVLSSRKALDDATAYQVCAFVQCMCNEDEAEIYTKLLAKTLRLGVTAKTVNKVIPGLIPEWNVQQAYPIEKYPVKDGELFCLTQKLNGVRATYYNGELYARSGATFSGLEHITNELQRIDADGLLVFDGELTLGDKAGMSDNEAFRVATGIINSEDDDKTAICYTVFDVLPQNEFVKGESKAKYMERRAMLDTIDNAFVFDGCVSILPLLYSGTDQSEIDRMLDEMVKQDKEGLMLNLDVPYKCKRHNGILKIKRFYTMDLEIIGFEEGSGRLLGKLGAFVLSFKGNTVKAGSGFSDEQRSKYWECRETLVGSLCEVKYKEISYDKSTGVESLQFPVFVSLRTDKSDVSFW